MESVHSPSSFGMYAEEEEISALLESASLLELEDSPLFSAELEGVSAALLAAVELSEEEAVFSVAEDVASVTLLERASAEEDSSTGSLVGAVVLVSSSQAARRKAREPIRAMPFQADK